MGAANERTVQRRIRGRALPALAALVALVPVPGRAATVPMLIAHRGGAALSPENTMTAFRAAHARFELHDAPGWLELDTQFTSDGVLVVIHDATLDRTTDCSGAVVDHTAAEVGACDADPDPVAFAAVPTLAEVLAEGEREGWRLVVEIKDIPGEPGFDVDCTELADALASVVDATSFPVSNLVVQSFWPLCLDRLESDRPDIATLLLTSSSTFNDFLGVASPVGVGFGTTTNVAFATLRGYEFSAPDQDAIDLNAVVVSAAHLLGRGVVVWTVNDEMRMQNLGAIGVDGIISDRPDLLLSAFGF